MKNCPLCGHEYYDEARWCPECECDFPAGSAAEPPSLEQVAKALENVATGEDAGSGPAATMAERIDRLFRSAGEEPNRIWKLSPEHLLHVTEYEMAVSLIAHWKQLRK